MEAAAEVRIENDYYAWTFRQAALLRSQKLSFMDWENVTEELEGMGEKCPWPVEQLIDD